MRGGEAKAGAEGGCQPAGETSQKIFDKKKFLTFFFFNLEKNKFFNLFFVLKSFETTKRHKPVFLRAEGVCRSFSRKCPREVVNLQVRVKHLTRKKSDFNSIFKLQNSTN